MYSYSMYIALMMVVVEQLAMCMPRVCVHTRSIYRRPDSVVFETNQYSKFVGDGQHDKACDLNSLDGHQRGQIGLILELHVLTWPWV